MSVSIKAAFNLPILLKDPAFKYQLNALIPSINVNNEIFD